MHRRIQSLVSLALGAALAVGPPKPAFAHLKMAFAQIGITVFENGAQHTFGQELTFALSAAGETSITSVALLWQVSGDERTRVETPIFAPGRQVNVTFRVDLAAQPLLPFRSITYWWQIEADGGQSLTTERQSLFYDDNRFAWQSTSANGVSVHWVAGGLAFGQAAADVAAVSLPRANRNIGAPLPARLDIYLYPALQDLQSALRLVGREWIGGHADPALGTVLLAVPPGPEAGLQLQRDLPHELTHVLVYQRTQPAYASVPSWLDEGLAVMSESMPDSAYSLALQEAVQSGALIPVADLCGPFPDSPTQATLAYAESASLVAYILDRWGSARLSALLDAYADGASCEGGVQRVLGSSLAGLQAGWQADALRSTPWLSALRAALPWLLIAAIPASGLTFLALAPRRRTV